MELAFLEKLRKSWDEYSALRVSMHLSTEQLKDLRIEFEMEDDQVAGMVLSLLDRKKPYLKFLSNAITTYPIFLEKLISYNPSSTSDREEKDDFLRKANKLQEIIVLLEEFNKEELL